MHTARLPPLAALPAVGASGVPATAPVLAVASALLAWAAAPGLGLWPLAFTSWAPLLVALHRSTPRQALFLGALQGFVFNLGLGSWLFQTIRVFGGYSAPTCAALMAVLCAYHGARSALAAWLYARATQRGWPPGLVFGLALAGSEVAYPVLFPWYAGAAVHSIPLLVQPAEVGGPILVSVMLAAGSVALAEIGWARRERRPLCRSRLALAALVVLLLVGHGLVRIPAVDAASARGPAVTVGIVQANLPHASKSSRAALAAHRAESVALTEARHPDLLVWSETAVSAVAAEDRLEEHLHTSVYGEAPGPAPSVPVLTGAIVRRAARGGALDQRFNAAALIEPGGALSGPYYKNMLLAFGEYVPFGDRFPSLEARLPNAGRLTAGSTSTPLLFRGHPITALICYEDVFPSFVNRAVRAGAPELLVTLSNDVWFGRSAEPVLHLALARFRAVEHRRYLVRATNSGPSSFIDPVGRSLGDIPAFERGSRAAVVRLLSASTPYEVLGDAPFWGAALVVLAMAFWARRPAIRAGNGEDG